MFFRALLSALCIFSLSFSQLSFTAPPSFTANGGTWTIAFAVSDSTDVEVSIVSLRDSTVVRHLAAGVLGSNPPAPLQPNTLSQTLYWDHRTDRGDRVNGSTEVVVGLGLLPRLDRTYGWDARNQYAMSGGLIGIAVDQEGHVITLHQNRMLMFNQDGSYLRTLSPYPGDLPEDKAAGFGRVSLSGGKSMPVVYQGHMGVVLPEMEGGHRQGLAVSPQGWVVMSNEVWGSIPYGNANFWGGSQAECRRALILGLDGSCPRASVFGPVIYSAIDGGHVFLAVSPGGRYLYAAGLRVGMFADLTTTACHHAVYRAPLDSRDTARIFVGQEGAAGLDSVHFNDPRGVAADKNGNVYVADYGNRRVMIYDSNGVYLQKIPVTGPDQVQVNRSTGEVFVLNLEGTVYRIRKFGPYPALDSMAVFSDNFSDVRYPPLMALDDHAAPARLWVGPNSSGLVMEIADNGTSLTRTSKTIGTTNQATLIPKDPWMPNRRITVSPDEKWMMIGYRDLSNSVWVRMDLATGAIFNTSLGFVEMEFGPDTLLYGFQTSYDNGSVSRYTAMGTPVPFQTPLVMDTLDHWSRGLAVADNGDIYVPKTMWRVPNASGVHVYRPDGSLKQKMVLQATGISVQVDPQGNLYVMENVRPKGLFYPPDFLGQFPSSLFPQPWTYHLRWEPGILNYYLFHYGSVLKFPPSGGKIEFVANQMSAVPIGNLNGPVVPAAQVDGFYTDRVNVTGALWQYFGVGINSIHSQSGMIGDISCECRQARFSLDRYGRILVPDAFHFSVLVLDNNKNEICRFGEYGNADNHGEGSARPSPAIPMAFPMNAKAGNNNTVYVDDANANRVLRVKLGYSVYWSSISGIATESGVKPAGLYRMDVFPSPAGRSILVRMGVPRSQRAALSIHDISGRLVKSFAPRAFPGGLAEFRWDAADDRGQRIGKGVYLLRLRVGNQVFTRRALVAG